VVLYWRVSADANLHPRHEAVISGRWRASSSFRAASHGGGPRPSRIALRLAANLFLAHPLTTRAQRDEPTKLDPAPQTSGFDGRDHGNPSDVQMTRAGAAALRDRMGGCIFALAVALEAGA
jgi:hypothetical protein